LKELLDLNIPVIALYRKYQNNIAVSGHAVIIYDYETDLATGISTFFVYNPGYPDYEEELRTYEQLREHNDENNSQYYWKWQEVVTYNVGTLSDDTVLNNSNF